MPQDLIDCQSKLVQVMAWCRQATSHYVSPCWPRSMLPYGVTRPRWVKHKLVIFKHISRIDILSISCEIAVSLSGECHKTSLMFTVTVAAGNGLVPSGNKPSPEPMFTKIYVTIWHHLATMSVTLWGLSKISDVLQATFPDAFCWMKTFDILYSNFTVIWQEVLYSFFKVIRPISMSLSPKNC